MNYPLTVIILTFNEESNLPPLLKSLEGVKANFFAVDSYSSDGTLQILQKHGISYLQHPFENYSRQRNWAQDNNPFHSEWILHIDAGERLTKEFVQWINNQFDPGKDVDGYIFSRRTMIFGKEIKHGGQYPQYHLRLFKPSKGRCEDKMYDQHFYTTGKAEVIKNRVDIIDTVLENWQSFIIGHSRWAVFEAMEQIVSSKKVVDDVKPTLFGSPIQRQRWLKTNVFQKTPLFLRCFMFFIYSYIFRFGFLDGKTGLAFHLLQKFWFRFLIDATILELRTKMKNEGLSLAQIVEREYGDKYLTLLQSIQKSSS